MLWKEGNPRYSQETENYIDKVISDESILARIDRLAIKGTKVVCIKTSNLVPPKNYDNFREFLEKRKLESYAFVEGEIYEVERIYNEVVYINRYPFELLNMKDCPDMHMVDRYPYVFDVFRTVSEDMALTREENINEILS